MHLKTSKEGRIPQVTYSNTELTCSLNQPPPRGEQLSSLPPDVLSKIRLRFENSKIYPHFALNVLFSLA